MCHPLQTPIRQRGLRSILGGGRARVAVQVLFSALVVGVLVWRGYLADLAHAVSEADWKWALFAAPLGWLSLMAHGIRWWLLMRRAGRVPLRTVIRVLLAAG